MNQRYMAVRKLPFALLLRMHGLKGLPLSKGELEDAAHLIRDYHKALDICQRQLITLQQEVDKLRQENRFLTQELQERVE